MSWTCPGCSNACVFKTPKMFELPSITIPSLPLPTFTPPSLPTMPTFPTVPDPLFKFGGTLPTISNPWSGGKTYTVGMTVEALKPSTGEKGERKTILTYTAQNAGTGGTSTPVWGTPEVIDGAVTLKLTKSNSGTAGNCPNSQGSKK